MSTYEQSKKCGKCLKVKNVSEFYARADKKKTDGSPVYRFACKSCHTKDGLIRYEEKYKGYGRRKSSYTWLLKSKYGLTEEQYTDIIKDQKGLCPICSTEIVNVFDESTLKHKSSHVDHCHSSGKVRGVLCHGCNTGLGMFKEDVRTLTKAARYLHKWTT